MFKLRTSLRFLSASACPVCTPAPTLTLRAAFHSSRSSRSPALESTASSSLPPLIGVEGPLMASPAKRKRTLMARKAAIALTPTAVERIRDLLASPTPQLIRVGVRNKGCAGMSYHLEYVEKPERFDEIVEQDGVKVVLDSKALFSIIGSEMDWQEDALGAKFVFNNPNIKDACGCGESFTV